MIDYLLELLNLGTSVAIALVGLAIGMLLLIPFRRRKQKRSETQTLVSHPAANAANSA